MSVSGWVNILGGHQFVSDCDAHNFGIKPNFYVVELLSRLRQQWLKHMLPSGRQAFGGECFELASRFIRLVGGYFTELNTVQPCAPGDGDALRRSRCQRSDRLGHPPLSEDLHRPGVYTIRLRITGESPTSLQYQAPYPGPSESESAAQTNGPRPDDQHLWLITHIHSPHRRCAVSREHRVRLQVRNTDASRPNTHRWFPEGLIKVAVTRVANAMPRAIVAPRPLTRRRTWPGPKSVPHGGARTRLGPRQPRPRLDPRTPDVR